VHKRPPEIILKAFPKLATDTAFKVTSDRDPNYNCISWSTVRTDVFIWPTRVKIDGVYWPDHLPCDTNLSTFMQLYADKGYEVCDDHSFEEGFQKIAIYQDPSTGEVTHAARQRADGYWTSKLGYEEDIQHLDPFTIENIKYGFAVIFMKRPNSSSSRKPRTTPKYIPRSKRKKKK
jgi:hypothetical protein